MAKTNLQRKISYYQRFLEEAKNSPHSKKYEDVCTALKNLIELSEEQKKPGVKISPASLDALKTSYRNVQTACNEYFAHEEEFSSFEQKRKGVIKDISSMLSKDLTVLDACNPMEPVTLSELIDKSRTRTIVLSPNDIQSMGASLSSRIPLKTIKGTKGFFTIKSTYNQDEKWAKNLDKYKDIFGSISEKCKNRMELLKTDKDLQDRFSEQCPAFTIETYANQGRDEFATKKILDVAVALGLGDTPEQANYTIKMNKGLKKHLINFISDIIPVTNTHLVMNDAGIKKDSVLSSRNCAMTDMAKLLDCEGLLANSIPMKIRIGDKEVEGVFMETVDGSDINRMKENDPMLYADSSSFENAEALKQFTDLQVFDFICGNVDRHMGNIIFQFGSKGDKSVTLNGIKGIDNDCSFGTPQIQEGKQIKKMVNPENMQFITTSMFENIMKLSRETVAMKLGTHHLSKEEINAVWDRITMVKDAIENNKIKRIDNDYWKTNLLSNCDTKENNYFDRLKGMAIDCSKDELGFTVAESEINYAQDSTDKTVMFDKLDEITTLRESLNKAKSIIYDSSEYKLMDNSFKKIETLTKKFREEYGSADMVPRAQANLLRSAYVELANTTSKYITLKSLVPSTVRGEKRLQGARDLLNFATDTLKDMLAEKDLDAGEAENEQDMEL